MKNGHILALIKQKVGILILVGVLVAALSFLFLVVTEKNFKVSTDFLVVQDQTESQDFYSLSRSAEYISGILSESVYSELFVDEVVKVGEVNEEFLPFDRKKRLKEWSNIINVTRNAQVGIISIETFSNDPKEALRISESIANVMTTKNYLFRGKVGLDVRVLSGPIAEKNPDINKIISVAVGGFLLGFLISLAWVYYRQVGNGGTTQVSNKEYKESLEYLDE
ncbi:chain length determinant protein [bacterium BMS3Abin15]|nr:chain length determinant protein [bacterium BMS3Abin15]HDZ85691.1 hypothetical protein [Candidatus Moranbacteria bacterium]